MPVRLRTAARSSAVSTAVATGLVLGTVPALLVAAPAGAETATRIAVRTNHSVYVAGQTIKIGIHLLNAPRGQVTLYAKIPGHATRAVFGGQVDDRGYAHIAGQARYNTTFTVKYAGDAGHTASRDATSVSVRALVVARAAGGKKAGKYRSYAAGKKAAVAAGAGPSKGGKRLTFRLQRLSKAGHWATRQVSSYKLNSKGVTAVRITGASGRKYRVRAEYAADRVNHSNRSSWVYVKFRK